MESKLEQLTQKLYDEGLAKGKGEAEKMVREAEVRAEKIVKEARAKAEQVEAKAAAAAEEMRKNTLTEVTLAGRGAVARIKEQIESLIVASAIDKGVHAAAIDPEFIKKILLETAHGWNPAGGKVSLEALLPEARRGELDAALKGSAGELLGAGIEVGYSPEVRSGVRVGPKGGGYYVSLEEDALKALLTEYLRPRIAKLLFE